MLALLALDPSWPSMLHRVLIFPITYPVSSRKFKVCLAGVRRLQCYARQTTSCRRLLYFCARPEVWLPPQRHLNLLCLLTIVHPTTWFWCPVCYDAPICSVHYETHNLHPCPYTRILSKICSVHSQILFVPLRTLSVHTWLFICIFSYTLMPPAQTHLSPFISCMVSSVLPSGLSCYMDTASQFWLPLFSC